MLMEVTVHVFLAAQSFSVNLICKKYFSSNVVRKIIIKLYGWELLREFMLIGYKCIQLLRFLLDVI